MTLRPRPPALLAALLAIGLSSSPAVAQPAPPARAAPAAAIVPPRPLAPLTADYPPGGQGDAEVLVAVVVNADGSVRSARAVGGIDPFASAAVAASSRWRFDPATRGGKPIAATIRARIRFTAPKPVAPEPKTPDAPAKPRTPGAPGAPPAPPALKPLEVTVHGEIPAPGVQTLSRAEVRLLPGAFGDPFRAVDALPGVTPLASGLPFFYVRGSPPGNVGYYLDGIRVPLLYHIGLGPSVIHPAIMDRVDLYPGAYPASFGRYAGGIVSGETKAPSPELHAEANIRLVDAGVMAEGPLPKDSGSFFVAGRYSYTGLLLSVISSSVDLGYWDYQARGTVHLTARDDLTLFAFGAHDFLGTRGDVPCPTDMRATGPCQGTTPLFDTTFHRVDLRYDHRLGGPDDRLRVAATYGHDQTSFDKGSFAGDDLVGMRFEITKRASDTVLVRAGADGQLDHYRADLTAAFSDAAAFTSLFSNRTDLTLGVHADAVIDVTRRLEVTPGVRVDYFRSRDTSAVGVDPRLAARLAVNREIRLIAATGLASQPPSFILPGPGFTRDLTGGLQRSWQSSMGVELDLPLDITGTATVFRNAFFNMTDALGTATFDMNDIGGDLTSRTNGSSVGLEILLKRRLTRRLGGLVSYTLSRSERILPTGPVPSAFDRTHVLNVAGSYDFGHGYRAGTRIVFYTGYPVDAARPALGRIPSFGRFDARIEKQWRVVHGKGRVSLVLEGENVFGARETVQVQCLSLTSQCSSTKIGPVSIPSIGLEGGF